MSTDGAAKQRRTEFFERLLFEDLRRDLSPDLLGVLETGDRFTSVFQGAVEPLIVSATRRPIAEHTNWDHAFLGAAEKGLVVNDGSDEAIAFRNEREVVSIISEPHGAVEFIYDSVTGILLWPREERLAKINSTRGDTTTALNHILDGRSQT